MRHGRKEGMYISLVLWNEPRSDKGFWTELRESEQSELPRESIPFRCPYPCVVGSFIKAGARKGLDLMARWTLRRQRNLPTHNPDSNEYANQTSSKDRQTARTHAHTQRGAGGRSQN
jgi:hypothetical protein